MKHRKIRKLKPFFCFRIISLIWFKNIYLYILWQFKFLRHFNRYRWQFIKYGYYFVLCCHCWTESLEFLIQDALNENPYYSLNRALNPFICTLVLNVQNRSFIIVLKVIAWNYNLLGLKKMYCDETSMDGTQWTRLNLV